MTVSGIRWLGLEVGGVDAERRCQSPNDIQAERLPGLGALQRRDVNVGPLGELALQKRTPGAPVLERRRKGRRRTRRHVDGGDGTGFDPRHGLAEV
jgi:hypothetical protein